MQAARSSSSSKIPYSSCKSVVCVVGTLNFIAFGRFPFLAFHFASFIMSKKKKAITHTHTHIFPHSCSACLLLLLLISFGQSFFFWVNVFLFFTEALNDKMKLNKMSSRFLSHGVREREKERKSQVGYSLQHLRNLYSIKVRSYLCFPMNSHFKIITRRGIFQPSREREREEHSHTHTFCGWFSLVLKRWSLSRRLNFVKFMSFRIWMWEG